MKTIKRSVNILGSCLALIICSCNKDVLSSGASANASITIVNAVPNSPGMLLKFNNGATSYANDQASVSYQSFFEHGGLVQNLPITIVSSDDTLHALYNGHINEKNGGIYSLYLFGQASPVQSMLVEEAIPAHRDSTSGVRFVNLSADEQTYSVILDGNSASQSEFPNIKFKDVTTFKNYSCNSLAISTGGYNFDIIDENNNIVANFFWSFSPFKNNTLVISGAVADGSLSVFQINNY